MTSLWTAAAALLGWYVVVIAGEVTYVTLSDGRKQERSLPLIFKLLLPLTGNFNRLLSRPFFAEHIAQTEKKLIAAGFQGLLGGRELVAMEFMLPLAPGLWLRRVLKKRHAEIFRDLPFVLDLLTLSVEAGMDFVGALQRNCAGRRMSPLNEELLRVICEVQLGRTRKEALSAMAERVGQSDLKAFAAALIQAEELGVAIGPVLRIQSEQMRSRRFDRAEKCANEAPVKMLFPLMLCIFPAVFIVLLGPVLMQAVKGGLF